MTTFSKPSRQRLSEARGRIAALTEQRDALLAACLHVRELLASHPGRPAEFADEILEKAIAATNDKANRDHG